jgi:UDPglucose 6-dehydrogenase
MHIAVIGTGDVGLVSGACFSEFGVSVVCVDKDADKIARLQAAGAQVRAFDPEGMAEAKKLMADIEYCGNSYETMAGADALVLVTEWNEFRALDLARVKSLLKTPTIIDLRNIYKPANMAAAGFFYTSVGRATPAASPAALRNLA